MRFLFLQTIIVILLCIFIATLSSLTELGLPGWLLTGASGYALYKIYRRIRSGFKTNGPKEKHVSNDDDHSDLSRWLESLMFDDMTGE